MPSPPHDDHPNSLQKESVASSYDPIVARSLASTYQHLHAPIGSMRPKKPTQRASFSAVAGGFNSPPGLALTTHPHTPTPPAPISPPVARSENSFEWSNLVTHPIVCVMNIPWDLSTRDISKWLKEFSLVEFGTHVLMDRSNDDLITRNNRTLGKTLPYAFIEVASMQDAKQIVNLFDNSVLKNRQVAVKIATVREFYEHMFPSWGMIKNDSDADVRTFVTRSEITALVTVCKSFKLHFSRKCADRPFENIMSIIKSVPWKNPHVAPKTMHRDHLFEMYKVATDALRMHLSKEYHHVSNELMKRMVRLGVMCPGFTERQKLVMLQAAGMQCPPDLVDALESSAGSIHDMTGNKVIVPLPPPEVTPSMCNNDERIRKESDMVGKACERLGRVTLDSSILKDHEDDILNYYQKELSRSQQKCRVLEERLAHATNRVSELELEILKQSQHQQHHQ